MSAKSITLQKIQNNMSTYSDYCLKHWNSFWIVKLVLIVLWRYRVIVCWMRWGFMPAMATNVYFSWKKSLFFLFLTGYIVDLTKIWTDQTDSTLCRCLMLSILNNLFRKRLKSKIIHNHRRIQDKYAVFYSINFNWTQGYQLKLQLCDFITLI